MVAITEGQIDSPEELDKAQRFLAKIQAVNQELANRHTSPFAQEIAALNHKLKDLSRVALPKPSEGSASLAGRVSSYRAFVFCRT